ncbi:general secretion pathway protein D [Paraburkholderia bannensis]|uniref:General secretion pathway protein D n=1 Tax=Paraburkholderia bannensis TaxID=765414 RepID=A0A7W9WVN5_9BURK|nr:MULTISPECIES: secretin N-terminal domain-containing protein [Paraburkholderia]MBB3260714.1 general secretion pathway protein D [Paraburkholderia sp. WP4_3_2]MBB6105884.1 general secretion pathway protein D [Paraburkholderia bannensis]
MNQSQRGTSVPGPVPLPRPTRKTAILAVGALLASYARIAAASVVMNFAHADIGAVAHAIGEATGKTIIVDPRVKGQIDLVSAEPVPEDEALKTLQSALRMRGFSLLQDHGILKVVPEVDAKNQGVPTYVGNQPVAKGDQIITQVFQLHRESAATLQPVLRQLISPNNTVTANASNNTLVVTDYADNVQRIAAVIAGMEAASAPHIAVVQLNFADATDVAQQAAKVLDLNSIGNSDPTQKVVATADTRSNAIILRSSSAARLDEAQSLIIKLDTPTRAPGNIHIVTLRNADATELARTLRGILGQSSGNSDSLASAVLGASSQSASGLPNSNGSLPPLPSGSDSSSTKSATSSGSSSSASSASGQAQGGGDQDDKGAGEIVADTSTNSLIITAPEPVFRNLSTVIARLDQRKVQVYIESLIMEVNSEKDGEFGIEWMTTSGLESLAETTTDVGVVAGFGNILGTKGLLRALQTNSDVNVLSTPSLVTLDNHEARILVGSNVPIESGSYSTSSSSSSAANAFNTYSRTDVGIILNVKPQINEGGTITMQVYSEDSSVESDTSTQSGGFTIDKRSLQTTILADDGQIIALGGLISDSYTNGNTRTPWISKIPVIGALFRHETKSRQKKDLLVFLRPVIVKDGAMLQAIASDRYGYMQARSKTYKSDNWLMKDDTVPALPSTDGKSGEIVDLTHVRQAAKQDAIEQSAPPAVAR